MSKKRHPDTVNVKPNPRLPAGAFVPGVSPHGTELAWEEAKPWLESGAVVRVKPKTAPPRAPSKPTPKPAAPEE
jgi:hypothetical protein